MGKSSAPAAPDYVKAAEATAAGNLEAAQYATEANRVDQYGPDGSITYTQDGDKWTQNTTLSPAQQALYDQNNQISQGLLGTASQGLDYVNQMMANPTIDESLLPQRSVNAGQTGQDAIMARLNPQFDRSEDRLRTQLANQGITEGSEAYSNSMRDFNLGKNDAYSQAALQGISLGDTARQQAIQEQAYNQDRPLNIVNALRTGNQTNMPQFAGYTQQATTAGPNYSQAAGQQYQGDLNSYNAQVGQQNSAMNGLFNAGGSAAMFFSDERLKKDITKIGETVSGLGVYLFKYLWSDEPEIGVIAQDVEKVYPDRVIEHPSGFLMVDYGRVG